LLPGQVNRWVLSRFRGTHKAGGGRRALVASACTRRGRALPVAWRVVSSNRFHQSQNAVEDRFAEHLSQLVDVERS
jgi:hypothetical protein